MLERAERASHIDPPASSHAIMQRAGPTAERTLDPARMFAESLTPRPELENSQDPLPKSGGSKCCDAQHRLWGYPRLEESTQDSGRIAPRQLVRDRRRDGELA